MAFTVLNKLGGVIVSDTTSNTRYVSRHTIGFTLIELLVTLTVLAILFIFAIPSLKTILMNNRMEALRDALSNSLNYARQVAVSQNTQTIVCPFSGAGSSACGGNWQNGWIVINQTTVGTSVLLQSNATDSNAPILSMTPIGAVGTNRVTFDARGISTTQANFKLCDSRGSAFAQSVEVLPTGFVQSGTNMGIAVWDGSGLTCP